MRRALALAACGVALVAAGCGSSDDETDAAADTTSASTPASASGSGDGVAEARAAVERASAGRIAGFPKPEERVDPGSKRVAIIGAGFNGGGVASYLPDLRSAVAAIGWEADYFDGQYKPPVQSGFIQRAVDSRYDAIVLMVLDPAALSSAFERVVGSGIPAVCVACGPSVPDGIAPVSYDMEGDGDLQADWIIADSDGKARVLVIDSGEFEAAQVTVAAAVKRFEEACSDCEIVDQESVLISDILAPNSTFFSSFLASHPPGSFDYVLSPFDAISQSWAQQAAQRGRTEIKITGQGPQEQYFSMVASGEPPNAAMTMSAPQGFLSWAALDLAARSAARRELWDAGALPLGIVDKESASEFDPKHPYVEPDYDYEAHFESLWGAG